MPVRLFRRSTRHSLTAAVIIAIALPSLLPPAAIGQCTVPQSIATLTAPTADFSDEFGYSVSVSGDTVAVGAPKRPTVPGGGTRCGSVFIYTRTGNTWTLQQEVRASNFDNNQRFGHSVALSGSTLLVGAINSAGGGSAYIFNLSGSDWSQTTELQASDRSSGDAFGFSVALSSTNNRRIAVIGAPFDDNTGPSGASGGTNTGCAYVFTLNTLTPGSVWTQQQKVMPDDGGTADAFGSAVSCTSTTAVIGSPDDDSNFIDGGSAYIFTGNITASSWTQQAKLVADTSGPAASSTGDRFGAAVASSANTVIVGAPLCEATSAPGVNDNVGCAYIFERSGTLWTRVSTITENREGYLTGHAVAVNGDRAFASSPGASMMVPQQLTNTYLYQRSAGSWISSGILGEFTYQPHVVNQVYGQSVAMSGTIAAFSSISGGGVADPFAGEVRLFNLVAQVAPVILEQPQDVTASVGDDILFHFELAPSSNVATRYRWQYELAPGTDTWANVQVGTPGVFGTVTSTTGRVMIIFDITEAGFRRYRCSVDIGCADSPTVFTEPMSVRSPICIADMGSQGGIAGPDGTLDNNDFIAFINFFFDANPAADIGMQGGFLGSDGQFDNNDFIAFIDQFFAAC